MTFPTKTTLMILTVILVIGVSPSHAAKERTVTIDTRPGVSVGAVVVEPDGPPVAAVILFIGGHGKLRLWRRSRPLPLQRGNFLVRARQMFAGHGFLTIVVDAPSDQRKDGLFEFRHSIEHRQDIAAVMSWTRRKTDVPLWLIGTSRGTVSVCHLAATLKIDGAVFTASVTEQSSKQLATALDGKLEAVTAPTLIVHNNDDDCHVTPANNVHMIRDRLKNSAAVEVMMFDGGTPTGFDVCGPMSYHGFLGIEDRVVAAIAGWIRAHLPAPAPK